MTISLTISSPITDDDKARIYGFLGGVVDGKISGKPYIKDSQGAVWRFKTDASGIRSCEIGLGLDRQGIWFCRT